MVENPIRALLRIEGLVTLALCIVLYFLIHATAWIFIVLLLAPDLGMCGYLKGTQLGAWTYNAFHTYSVPLALALASFAWHWILPFALIWAAHIAMDRALGYGLKYEDAFTHTHLGRIGKDR